MFQVNITSIQTRLKILSAVLMFGLCTGFCNSGKAQTMSHKEQAGTSGLLTGRRLLFPNHAGNWEIFRVQNPAVFEQTYISYHPDVELFERPFILQYTNPFSPGDLVGNSWIDNPNVRFPGLTRGFFCRFEDQLARKLPIAVDFGTD